MLANSGYLVHKPLRVLVVARCEYVGPVLLSIDSASPGLLFLSLPLCSLTGPAGNVAVHIQLHPCYTCIYNVYTVLYTIQYIYTIVCIRRCTCIIMLCIPYLNGCSGSEGFHPLLVVFLVLCCKLQDSLSPGVFDPDSPLSPGLPVMRHDAPRQKQLQ